MEKFNLIHAARYFGKAYDAAQMLYHRIQKANEYILFKSPKGNVHIFPEDKLDQYVEAQIYKLFTEGGENLTNQFRGRQIKLTKEQLQIINHSIKLI